MFYRVGQVAIFNTTIRVVIDRQQVTRNRSEIQFRRTESKLSD